MSIALELDRVSAGYGHAQVLRDVDLRVPEGKAVALLGANGAGKTTLLKTAAGLLPTLNGTINLFGRPVQSLRAHRRSRQNLCLIPEGRGIFRGMSVRENLATFARGMSTEAAIEQAATLFPVLGERLRQDAGTLSGGQQQMLAVARALVTDARVILADELSLGLAPVVVDEIFAAIDVMRDQNRSLLIVEQYINRVLDVCDYVYILHKGRVVFVGEPAQCHNSTVFERYLGAVA